MNGEEEEAFAALRTAAARNDSADADDDSDAYRAVTAGVAKAACDLDEVLTYACLGCGQQWLAFRNLKRPAHCPGCGRPIARVTR